MLAQVEERTALMNWELVDDGLELTTGLGGVTDSSTCSKQPCLTSAMGGNAKSHVFMSWSWK